MKRMRKLWALLLVCVMVLSFFAACGGSETAESTGTEAADIESTESQEEIVTSRNWEADKDNHWRLNSNGEQTDLEAHTLNDGICEVCGAEIYDFGNGEIWVMLYNEQGDTVLDMSYQDGEIVQNLKKEYTYDEEGRWATCKTYSFGVLTSEMIFHTVTDEDGWSTFPVQTTAYNKDGSKLVKKSDESGWAVGEALYDADGNLVYDYTITNEFGVFDQIASIRKYEGDTLVSEVTYEYDEEGNSAADRYYSYGELTEEYFYTSISVDDATYSYLSKTILYNEDGTQTVTEYDEYGNEIA